MRLIDADMTIQRLKEWNTDDPMDKALYSFAVNRINEQPTIEGRKLGNWVGIDDEPCETFECDRCGFVLEDWIQGAFYNFCPNCGADMKGGEDRSIGAGDE